MSKVTALEMISFVNTYKAVCPGALLFDPKVFQACVEHLSNHDGKQHYRNYCEAVKTLLTTDNSDHSRHALSAVETLPINIKGTVFQIADRNLLNGIKSIQSSIEKLKAERVELRKVSEVHKHNTALVAIVGEYCRDNSVGEWGGSAVESLISSHSERVGEVEKLKAERVELRERDMRSSELVERVHKYCEARDVIRKVGQCPVDALMNNHSDYVGTVEVLNKQVERYETILESNNKTLDKYRNEVQPACEHERHMCEMLLRMMRGQPVEVKSPHSKVFLPASTRAINTEREYRVPVKKLVIPWEHIKPEYKFAAMDEDGEIYLYTQTPSIDNGSWERNAQGEDYIIGALVLDTDGIDWQESLTERPNAE